MNIFCYHFWQTAIEDEEEKEMKNYFYTPNAKAVFSDGTEIPLSVNEFTFEFHPTKENVADLTHEPYIVNRNVELSFTVDITADYLDMFPKKSIKEQLLEFQNIFFRKVEIVTPNRYIDEQTKRGFYKCQESGFIFDVRFRQEIYPKLQAHITFLTYLKLEVKENVD